MPRFFRKSDAPSLPSADDLIETLRDKIDDRRSDVSVSDTSDEEILIRLDRWLREAYSYQQHEFKEDKDPKRVLLVNLLKKLGEKLVEGFNAAHMTQIGVIATDMKKLINEIKSERSKLKGEHARKDEDSEGYRYSRAGMEAASHIKTLNDAINTTTFESLESIVTNLATAFPPPRPEQPRPASPPAKSR
jgi:hypothetical protein